jgi:hypothetical protein
MTAQGSLDLTNKISLSETSSKILQSKLPHLRALFGYYYIATEVLVEISV